MHSDIAVLVGIKYIPYNSLSDKSSLARFYIILPDQKSKVMERFKQIRATEQKNQLKMRLPKKSIVIELSHHNSDMK